MSRQVKLQGHPIAVGDEVWSIKRGWGFVSGIDDDVIAHVYPIQVMFGGASQAVPRTYAPSGKVDINDVLPELFWDKVEFDLPDPPQLEVEEFKALLQIESTKAVFVSSNWYATVEEAKKAIDKSYKVLCLISETGRTRSKHHV